MIEIGRLAPRDLVPAGAVLDAAFDRQGMIDGLRAAYVIQPEAWFCVRESGRIAGVVGAIDYGPFASVGMMAIHPRAQGQGLGRALMAHLVDELDTRGCPMLILDASAAGRPLYPKLGFEPEGDTLRMIWSGRAHAPSESGPLAAGEVSPMQAADLPLVADFDAPIFGAHRQPVIDSAFQSSGGRGFVARNLSGQIEGYLIAARYHIGPFSAENDQIAERLLVAARTLPYDFDPALTFPAANTACRQLLARYGFVCTESLLHMRRGGDTDPRDCGRIFAQASLALG